ncbi:MAG TPA: hypothetical protein VH393_12570 [Ktedonobacterales bacterium]|jgi:hypothetical protein
MNSKRLLGAEITVFAAYIAFVVAGMVFAKMVEYDDFSDVTHGNALITVAFNTLVAGAYIALLAVVIGGLPLAFAAARYAITTRRWRILALLATPLLAFAALIGYAAFVGAVLAPTFHTGNGVTPGNVVLFLGLGLVFVLGAAFSVYGVARAVRESEISPRLLSFALIPALVTTLAMAVVTVALIVWGIALRSAAPDLFGAGEGILETNVALNWLGVTLVMTLATIIAIIAIIAMTRSAGNLRAATATA